MALIRGAERQPPPGAHLRLARPRQDRLPQARRVHVRRALRRDRRRPPAQLARRRAPTRTRGRADHRRRARRGSRRSSRCCSPSTRCTATCTGTTRCAARRRCTSGSWTTRSRAGSLSAEALAALHRRGAAARARAAARPSPLLAALRERRLYKRAFECPAAELPADGGEWIADDRAARRGRGGPARARARARPPASCCSTIRPRPRCSASTFPSSGGTARCGGSPPPAGRARSTCPKLSEELYRSARWLRVFACRRVDLRREAIVRLATLPAPEVRERLAEGRILS